MNRVSSSRLEYDREFCRSTEFLDSLFGENNYSTKRMKVLTLALRDTIQKDLTPRQREMLTLKYVHKMKSIRIARQLGVNPSTVTRTLLRAEKKIQHSMRFYIKFLRCDMEDE